MLLALIRDLRANDFILPRITTYNSSGIPFAYPPLAMYVAAVLSSLSSISELDLLRWLPPLASAILIPVFYWLAQRILGSRSKAIIATLLYAVMPGSSDWLVMGGGLTRSFGVLFSLLAIGYAHRLFNGQGDKKNIGLATLFCALAVLSHPEVGLQAAAAYLVFLVIYGRKVSGLVNAAMVASGTAALTAPWWLTVLRYHGFSPFESAVQTGIRETLWASLFRAFFSTQGGVPVLPVFSLIGIYVVLRQRDLLLVLWTFVPFFIDPRNAPAMAIFPLVMLASEGMYYAHTEFRRAYAASFQGIPKAAAVLPWWTPASFALILLYFLLVSYRSAAHLAAISLSASDRETLQWIRENIPLQGRFLLITNRGEISPMSDSFQEWFPALAERQSRNTLQGLEWVLGSDFFPYSQRLVALQTCPDVHCLDAWLEQNSVAIDFILIQKKRTLPEALNSVRADERFEIVYESVGAEIFAFHP